MTTVFFCEAHINCTQHPNATWCTGDSNHRVDHSQKTATQTPNQAHKYDANKSNKYNCCTIDCMRKFEKQSRETSLPASERAGGPPPIVGRGESLERAGGGPPPSLIGRGFVDTQLGPLFHHPPLHNAQRVGP